MIQLTDLFLLQLLIELPARNQAYSGALSFINVSLYMSEYVITAFLTSVGIRFLMSCSSVGFLLNWRNKLSAQQNVLCIFNTVFPLFKHSPKLSFLRGLQQSLTCVVSWIVRSFWHKPEAYSGYQLPQTNKVIKFIHYNCLQKQRGVCRTSHDSLAEQNGYFTQCRASFLLVPHFSCAVLSQAPVAAISFTRTF